MGTSEVYDPLLSLSEIAGSRSHDLSSSTGSDAFATTRVNPLANTAVNMCLLPPPIKFINHFRTQFWVIMNGHQFKHLGALNTYVGTTVF